MYKERYAHRSPDGKLSYETRKKLAKWGLTESEYEKLYESQDGVCAICNLPETALGSNKNSSVKRLSVDHNHKTGTIRGLLCGNCNTGIGLLQDSVENLQKAIDYLTTHQTVDNY